MIVHGRCGAQLNRAVRQAVLALTVLGIVAGCETLLGEGSDVPSSNSTPKKPSPMDRPGAIVPAAPGQAQSDAPPSSEPAPPAIAALPPEPQIDADPERLMGMEPEAVTELLGQPTFVRNDAPSQLWRYRGPQCRLDLFLYETLGTGPQRSRVLHYTVQSNDDPKLSAEQCLRSLLLARMEKPTG